MRFKLTLALVVIIGFVFFYNTIWFQSFFLYKEFYKNIVNVHFDVTQKDAVISIPIHYHYKTCYDLGVAVPESVFLHSDKTGKGKLGYKFISAGKLLADGITNPVSHFHWTGGDDFSKIVLMVFDLPFPGASSDLTLELEVIEPFSFMSKYKGQTSIIINPDYNADVGKCYNDKLRINQPE